VQKQRGHGTHSNAATAIAHQFQSIALRLQRGPTDLAAGEAKRVAEEERQKSALACQGTEHDKVQ